MEAITREERLMSAAAGGEPSGITPITREEMFLAYAAGESDTKPKPITRREMFLDKIKGGGDATPTQEKTITITENGTVEVTPDEGYALGKVTATAQVYDGGTDPRVKQIVEGTITEFSDESIIEIAQYTFAYRDFLTSVNCPNVTEINNSCFLQCRNLNAINLPNAETIYPAAFRYCNSLTTIYFPKVTRFENSGSTGKHFEYCRNLTSANFPNVEMIGIESFRYCEKLNTVEIPKAEVIFSSAFELCENLVYMNLPSAITFSGSTFKGCAKLSVVEYHKLKKLQSSDFQNCVSLTTVVLRMSDTIGSLSNINAFTSTPFASGGTGGICLVPRALIESYQTATNWSTLYAAGTCLFWALEDYTVDGTITGEIDWDKLNADREGAFATV